MNSANSERNRVPSKKNAFFAEPQVLYISVAIETANMLPYLRTRVRSSEGADLVAI
jgi:hypothetical protein